jgi:biotin carboxylase
MDGKVVVLLRTSSVARAPVYRHLRSLGVVLVLIHPYHPLQEFDGVFHHWLQMETDDVDAVRMALDEFCAAHHFRPDAIVSFDEYAVFQAAVLAVEFHLTPVPLPPAAIQLNNLKNRFRGFCEAHHISSPKSVRLPLTELPSPAAMRECTQTDDMADGVFTGLRPALQQTISAALDGASMKFPVVVKPSPGAGSLLAKLCADVEETAYHVWCMWRTLAKHPDTKHFLALVRGASLSSAAAAAGVIASSDADGPLADASSTPSSIQILAEEYIAGQEVDIDCVVEHGLVRFCSISDNFAPSPPYFAEVGGLCPSALGFDGQRALRDLLESYVAACGDQLHGVLHFEAKYDFARATAYVIEVNCRPGSAETNTMLSTVYREVSLGESLVRCALQQPIHEQLARLFHDVMVALPQESSSHVSQSGLVKATTTAQTDGEGDETVVPMWRALGGPLRGFFPPQCWAASVNIYPTCAGVLRKVRAPTEDASLVAYSVSAQPGEVVAPPPVRFYLLSWMVARGKTAAEAKYRIEELTARFVQEVEPQLTE